MNPKTCDPSDLNADLERLMQLFWIGGTQIAILAKGDKKITFKDWSEAVKKATIPPGTTPRDEG
jgi:hypothetical protein